uniref:Reverse transcriptase Ty1/copia-type domain-containing protein n=1 Tax=Tanacetum cinerariifolium TaxID=118510 RepID=A0A6L2LQ85_TANCI|nr:hypothetical protein [Tanacetum cinerariifolium]
MNNKKCIVNLEYFREMLHICLRLPNQTFDELSFEEEILAFLRHLGHSGEIRKITDININKLHQPWRSFAVVINKFLSGKSTGYDSLRLYQSQILWGMYHKKNVDFAYLLWEDFVYQVEHKDAKKSNEMYYPSFTKLGAILPIELTNEDIKNSAAYKEYYVIASLAAPPKTKASVRKTQSSSDTTITPPMAANTRLLSSAKGKQPAKASKAKDKGTGILPGVLDVPSGESDEEISWKSSDEDDDEVDDRSDDQEDEDDQDDDDDDDQDTNNDSDDFVHPKLSIYEEESKDEASFDPIVQTPENSDNEGNDDASLGMNVSGEEGHDAEDEDKELYRNVNINLEGQDSSPVSSQCVTSMLNPSPDAGIDSLFESTPRVDIQASTTVAPFTLTAPTLPPPTILTISQVPQAPTSPSTFLQDLPNFSSLFEFDHRLKTLDANFSEFMKTSQFARAVSSILGIVERYMDQRMNEAVKEQVKEQVMIQVSKILPKIEKTVNEQLKAKVMNRSSNSSKTSYAMVVDLSKMELKKIIIEKMESNKNMYKALFDAYECDNIILDTYGDIVTLKRCRDDADKDEEPSAGSDRGSKRRREGKEPESKSAPKEKESKTTRKSTEGNKRNLHLMIVLGTRLCELLTEAFNIWISNLAKQADSRSSFNDLMDTLVDFSVFLMNRLKVDTLTPELLAGQQYPHNLLKPLPLIPNSQGRRVIPFDYFINYDLEYLRGGASSRMYTTSVTKTKAADYRHIKWIEDLIMEWHNYKHLDWITVRRDDDKLYKFKEGDFKRLRIQDIEDMLLLLVQGKLTNLTIEECFAFNVSLRMFTRSIVIHWRMEDLQLGVESYQKKLSLTKPDTDGMLNDVQTALDDRLKGQSSWIRRTLKDGGEEADLNNLESTFQVSSIPITRIYKDRLLKQVIRDLHLASQTKRMSKNLEEHGLVSIVNQRTNHKDLQNCLFDCFLSQMEHKKASFKDFVVYQMDVKSDFLYGKIEKEVYVCQPSGFEDPAFPDKVYEVEKGTLWIASRPKSMKEDGIFISQDKYVAKILRKFRFFEVKTASTPIETQKPLLKDKDREEVDVHIYRSMIGSLMYLTSSRPDIMFTAKHNAVRHKLMLLGKLTTARFIQMFLDKKLDGFPTHKEKYDVSFYTKKVFANMKRIGKVFSVKETELFPTMVGPKQVQIGVNIPRSDKDSLKHIELMKICTTLQQKVLDLEDELKRTKTAQQSKINGLERRVKKLEMKHMSRTHKLKRLYKVSLIARVISSCDDEALDKEDTFKQGRIDEIDADEDIVLVSTHDDMVLDEGTKDGKEEVVEVVTTVKMLIDTVKKDQILFDEEVARKLQEEIYEQERLVGERARQDKEANSALIETWEDIQAKMNADYQLAKKLQAEEQEQLTDAEKAKLFMEIMEKRIKSFAAKKTAEKRNKPPTKAQQKSIMSTYLKNTDGWKSRGLKNKSFAKIKELFDKAMTRINNFIDFRTELVEVSINKDEAEITQESSSKRAGDELDQERSKQSLNKVKKLY